MPEADIDLSSVVSVLLEPESSGQYQRLVDEIGRLDGIARVTLLKPGSKNARIARMASVYLRSDQDPAGVLERLRGLKGIERAELAAQRYLIPE